MDKKDDISINPKLAKEIVSSIVHRLYAQGDLADKDIKEKDALEKKMRHIIDSGLKFAIVIDYQDTILGQARHFKNKNEHNYAKLFYATFFEHSINGIIENECRKKKLSQKTKNEVLRKVNLDDKFGWMRELFQLPKFSDKHFKTIIKLADNRNAFIHYKYPPRPGELSDLDNEKEIIDQEFDDIEKAVRYMKTYDSRIKFKGKKAQLKKII